MTTMRLALGNVTKQSRLFASKPRTVKTHRIRVNLGGWDYDAWPNREASRNQTEFPGAGPLRAARRVGLAAGVAALKPRVCGGWTPRLLPRERGPEDAPNSQRTRDGLVNGIIYTDSLAYQLRTGAQVPDWKAPNV